jgi:two-component system LytT family sensor kinase
MATASFQDKRFKVAFIIWWSTWAAMQMVVLVDFGMPRLQAIVDSVITNLLLAGICLVISNNMRYYLPKKEKYWYVLVISLVLSAVWLLLIRIVLWAIYRNDVAYMQQLSNTSNIRYAIAFLVTGSMAMMNLLWHTQLEQKQTNERKTEAERLTKEAELFKLRQQLQPHFLFNSLNSISALTGTQPEKARHMIQQLSDFLRGTLKKDEQQWNTLAEELQYLQLYLDIEKVRFGYRLQTIINLEENVEQMKLPSMLLQPIVENAIKFGLYDTIGEVMILIEAKSSNGNLEVIVQNPFDAATAQPLQGTGFGLSSIQRRLFLLFARQDLLHTRSEEGKFITTIVVPQLNEQA